MHPRTHAPMHTCTHAHMHISLHRYPPPLPLQTPNQAYGSDSLKGCLTAMREEGLIAAADADDAGDDDDDDDESVKVFVNDEGEPFMKLNGDNRLTVRKYKSMVLIGKN